MRQTQSMGTEFSILGRGRAGRSLAAAWGDCVELVSHDAEPDGFVILAVPDDALLWQAARFPNRCLHLSGSLQLQGVPCAHPLTSFDGQARDWSGTPLALTGAVPDFIRSAFEALGFLPFDLKPELKPLYHACAVLTSGHAATLWIEAGRLLKASGIQLPGRGLMPLAESTVRNISERGAQGRTGPFVRGDEATIARDAEALPEAWQELFLKLGRMGF